MTPATAGLSVRSRVLTAWRATQLARLAESVLLGATALSLGLAAAVASSAPRQDGAPVASWPDAWGAALVCAFACALAWWLEHRARPAEVAARIDRKLHLEGALVTAFELEHPSLQPPSRVGRLLAERVARRATRRDGLRAGLPRSGPFLAPPLIAAGLLAATLEHRREPLPVVALDALAAGLAGEASELGSRAAADLQAGRLTPAEVRAALDLAARAGKLELRLDRGAGDGAGGVELGREARELQNRLEELLARIPPASGTARAAERTAAWADLLAAGAHGPGRAPAASVEAPEVSSAVAGGTGEGVEPGAAGGSARADSGRGGGPEVAAGPADGTMSGSPPEPGSASDPSGARASEGERGVAASRWWPARYDGVVERWVEARRARVRSESR